MAQISDQTGSNTFRPMIITRSKNDCHVYPQKLDAFSVPITLKNDCCVKIIVMVGYLRGGTPVEGASVSEVGTLGQVT